MLDVIIDDQFIRIGERFALALHRTLRIPDDGRTYPLPPGLGRFPLFKVSSFKERIPTQWLEQGGAFIPMYQREAMWIGFHAAEWKPNAVKIAVGGVNVISGEAFSEGLNAGPQNYIVCPDQPWLDGVNTGQGSIRQFVAMPLGKDYTIEASLTGMEIYGGIQVMVFEPKPGQFPDKPPSRPETGPVRFAAPKASSGPQSMGLGAGGQMKQKIYSDPYGIDVWDQGNYGRVAIHIVNSHDFLALTGKQPPPTPVDARSYTDCGLPWFDLYDEYKADVAPSDELTGVKTIAEVDALQEESTANNASVNIQETQIKKLGDRSAGERKRETSDPADTGAASEDEKNH
ncbi:MAG: hypothetical protein JRF29_04150 [Deltaproteobacteria bacterium]|jgi:hypothetical protein|nr:hypothetical protein [Deltaproteobacteria bacterium]